jgi:hypothetical protein
MYRIICRVYILRIPCKKSATPLDTGIAGLHTFKGKVYATSHQMIVFRFLGNKAKRVRLYHSSKACKYAISLTIDAAYFSKVCNKPV